MHFAVHFFVCFASGLFVDFTVLYYLPEFDPSIHPPEMETHPPKRACGCPGGGVLKDDHTTGSHPTACIYQCTTAQTEWFPILSRERYSNKPAKRTCSWTVNQTEWAGIPGPQQTCTLPLRSSSLPSSFWSHLRLLRLSQVFLSPPIPLNNNKKQKKPPPPLCLFFVLLVDLSPLQNRKQ